MWRSIALAFVLAFVLSPATALAGAWPRAPGEIYALVSHEGGEDGWTGFYVERGGPGALTFGLDVGGHVASGIGTLAARTSEPADMDGRVMAFARIPLPVARIDGWSEDWLLAAEAGIGADIDASTRSGVLEASYEFRYRLGLSVGRGLDTRFGPGWANVDLRFEGGEPSSRLGLAAVVGVKPRPRLAVELAVFAEREDDLSITLAPTVQYAVPRIGEARFGLAIDRDGSAGLRLGLARTF